MSAAMPRVSSTDFFKATKNGVDDVRIAGISLSPPSYLHLCLVAYGLRSLGRGRQS